MKYLAHYSAAQQICTFGFCLKKQPEADSGFELSIGVIVIWIKLLTLHRSMQVFPLLFQRPSSIGTEFETFDGFLCSFCYFSWAGTVLECARTSMECPDASSCQLNVNKSKFRPFMVKSKSLTAKWSNPNQIHHPIAHLVYRIHWTVFDYITGFNDHNKRLAIYKHNLILLLIKTRHRNLLNYLWNSML